MAIGALSTSLSALTLLNQQIDVTSGNIANASTEGYTRKQLPQHTDVRGEGVVAGLLRREMNIILQRDLFTQTSQSSALATKSRYFDLIQNFHRAPEDNLSITAEMGKLEDSFAEFANTPESTPLLDNVYQQADYVVERMNGFSNLLTEMRNDAQNEMDQVITRVNEVIKNLAELNVAIKVEFVNGRSTATLEDQRDVLLKELAGEIDISYYETTDKVVQVATRSGAPLVDTQPRTLLFNPDPIGPQTYYPNSVSGVFVDIPTGPDLAAAPNLGGRLGSLIELRDSTLPQYHAQLDELAHKTATRFAEAGLQLFTTPSGTIPANTPVDYAGFSAEIQINPDVMVDRSLIRSGTTGTVEQAGSSTVPRRVLEYVFGDKARMEALGNQDISVPGTLFATLGIDAKAEFIGTQNVQSLGVLHNSPDINVASDTFSIQLGAAPAQNILINPADTATDLVATINGLFPGMASIGPSNQLVLEGNEDITIANVSMTPAGLNELGITLGTTTAKNPSFKLGVGIAEAVEIEILPTDTGADLVTKINTLVPEVTASLDGSGFLQIVPDNGGDITLQEGLGKPIAALGLQLSEIDHTPFNVTNLGSGANINGRISTAQTLQEYAEFMISIQSADASDNKAKTETEEVYRNTLETELQNITAVNLDEEMANMIQIQTAYTASSKAIATVNQMLDDLFVLIR